MSLLEEECVEKVFVYKFSTCTTNQEYVLEIPLKIPYQGSIKELTYRIMSSFKLPCYVESDLMKTIERTIKELTLQFYDEKSEKVINATKKGDLNIEDIIKNLEKIYKQKTVEYADPIGTTDEELFATAYHRLVHSPSLEPILQAEHKYGRDVTEVIQKRNTDYEQLTKKQTEEMRVAVEALEAGSTEKSINDMVGRHFEEQSLLQGHWGSRVDALKLEQRRQYRNWIMRLLEEQQTNMLPTPVGSPMIPMPPIRPGLGTFVPNEEKPISDCPVLEESFTIHLGSQMKQMHNIRILTGDVLDFCRTKKSDSGDPTPQRLQTALGLYSNDLCGLVLLSDNHLGSYSGITKGSFIFPRSMNNWKKIRDDVKEAVAWRQAHRREGSDPQTKKAPMSKTLQTGDIFITRHSNLAQVHVVFHMVVNDSLRSGDINSRHPAILGLRNILKTACCYDVTTLTIPVLLVHEMTEEMTVAWCTKRAELVFKCVKGFMIEMASWGGAELKNLQFLVPKGMSEEVFGTLATMLPSIFRVSNPLVNYTNSGLKKEDFFLKIQTRITLSEVTDLILRQNQFDSFLDCSTNLSSLRTLDLSQNHLQRFFFLCKDEYNLQVLNVSHNMLEYIDDNALNNRIPKLKILDLSSNKLSFVNETILEHLKILEYLSLANNPIGDGIHENAFWSLTKLKHLDLRNISGSYFSGELFKNLTNLSTLDLSWNPISTIPLLPINLEELDISGTLIFQLGGLYLPRLREFKVNNMPNLTKVALNDLENLTSLEILSLVGCRNLIQFTVWPYRGTLLPRLQRLSIDDCALETLESDLRLILQRTAVVSLRDNPWKCDCRMQWVNINNSSKELNSEIRCSMPDRHRSKLLKEIPIYELECDSISSIFYPILWTCITLLISLIILLSVFFIVKRQGGQWTVRRRNRDTVTYTNVVESSNDLVRILNVSDNHERNDE
ncbi:hypothetical protein M0802_002282 [Mischocyttarus mexicanus]|nr:hypothetical protein M0802_002282 [Mischocyttarus mexicanus]